MAGSLRGFRIWVRQINISLPQSVSPPHRFGLTFKLLQWGWN